MWMDETDWLQKLFLLYNFIAIFAVLLVIISPENALMLIEYQSMLVPKIFIVLNFFLFIDEILWFIKRLKFEVGDKTKKVYSKISNVFERKEYIENIDIQNIINFLFQY